MACPALRVSLMHGQLTTTCHRQGAYRARRLWSLRPLATLLVVTLDPNKDWPILLTCRHRLCSETDMAFLRVFFSRCATGMGAGTSCYVADCGADILLLQVLLYVHRSHKAYYGRGAQDGHLDFHTAPELFKFVFFSFFSSFQCWFTSTETTRLIRDEELRTTTSTFTQLLNSALTYMLAGLCSCWLPEVGSDFKHQLTTSFLQTLPQLFTPQVRQLFAGAQMAVC